MTGGIPCQRKRMQSGRERGQRPATRVAGDDLTVENARHEDGRAIARDAFDEAVLWVDREERLRLDRSCRGKGQQSDQRKAPAMSFWSLEWMAEDPATYSPRSKARSAPR
jgi:hypothetical protein